MPSIVDFAGMNPINEVTLSNAIGALIGMVQYGGHLIDMRGEKYIATTLMGITNDTVVRAADLLADRGFKTISFHSTGIGGRVTDDWTGLYLAPFLHQAEGLFPYAAYRIESECSLQYPLLFERVPSAYSFA